MHFQSQTQDNRILLAGLWIFLLINIILRDGHHFIMPGFVETIFTGHLNGIEITPDTLLLACVVISVPNSMISIALIDLDDDRQLILQLVAIAGISTIVWL